MDVQLQALPGELARRDTNRLRRYTDNLRFYAGEQAESGTARSRRGRTLTLNYARAVVDKVTSYMMADVNFAVEPVGPELAPEARERAAAAEAALYRVAEANHLALLDFETEIDTAILGDGAFKVTWDPLARRVRVTAPDVQGIHVWTAGDDRTRIRRLAHAYRLTAGALREQFGLTAAGESAAVIEDWTAERLTI